MNGQIEKVSAQRTEKEKVFGGIFFAANALEAYIDRHLAPDSLTAKQWLLSTVIERSGEDGMILGEAAKLLGTSRQNVKQLALKLEENGYVTIARDESDARALRLRLTMKARRYWALHVSTNAKLLDSFFEGLEDREIAAAAKVLLSLYAAAGR